MRRTWVVVPAAVVAVVAVVTARLWWHATRLDRVEAGVSSFIVAGHGAMPTPAPAELHDLLRIGQSQKLTRAEALRRYAWQREFGRVAQRMSDHYESIYSSAEMDPPGWVGGVFRFTRRPPASALALMATLPVPSRVVTNEPYTEGQIETVGDVAGDAVETVLGDRHGGWGVSYDARTRSVDVDAATGSGSTEAGIAQEVTDYLRHHLPGLPVPFVRVTLSSGSATQAD